MSLWRVLLLAGIAVSGACASDPLPPAPVRVAVALPPPWGPEAMRLAVGALADRLAAARVEVFGDTTYGAGEDADRDVATAERLARDSSVVAVIGHGGSRPSLAAAPVYADAGIVQVVPTGTSRLLAGASDWLLAVAPNDSIEGEFIAAYAAEVLGARRVLLFFVNDEYGIGLRDGVVAGLRGYGVTILESISVGLRGDFDAVLGAALQRGRPDAVIVAARPIATGAIARGLAARGLPAQVVAGDGALIVPELLQEAGAAIDRIHAVAFWTPQRADPVSQAFVRQFRAMIGKEPHASHAMAYDAIRVVLEAILQGGRTSHDVRAHLTALGESLPPFAGVTGPVTFRADRDPNLTMVRIEGKRTVPVEARP